MAELFILQLVVTPDPPLVRDACERSSASSVKTRAPARTGPG